MFIFKARFCILSIGLFLAVLFMGCATVSDGDPGTIYYTEWHNNQIYKGKGGKVKIFNGVEFWDKDEPEKAYKIVGVVIHIKTEGSLDKLLSGEVNQDKLLDIIQKEKANGLVVLSNKHLISGKTTKPTTTKPTTTKPTTTKPTIKYSNTSVFAVFKYVHADAKDIKNVKPLR